MASLFGRLTVSVSCGYGFKYCLFGCVQEAVSNELL